MPKCITSVQSFHFSLKKIRSISASLTICQLMKSWHDFCFEILYRKGGLLNDIGNLKITKGE